MASNPDEMSIAADDVGIYFPGSGSDITVHWGEIEKICALWEEPANGTAYLRFFVDHFSGVDFQFTNVDTGYEQVMAEMEKQLTGFSRVRAESVGRWEAGQDIPAVWQRDVVAQPFQFQPPPVVPSPSSPEAAIVVKVWEAAGRPGPWESFWLQFSDRLKIEPGPE